MTTIGINILFLEPGEVGGSEIFARELLKRIDKDIAKKLRVIVYCRETFSKTVSYRNIILKSVLKGSGTKFKKILYELFVLPLVLIKDRVDLLHSMGYTSPIFTHCRKMVSILDTQFATVPYTVSFSVRLVYRFLMPLVAKSNKHIITLSNFSKREIVKNLGVSGSKISIVQGASDIDFRKPIERTNRGNYIMTSSATYPHKKVDRLVEAFAVLSKSGRFPNLELKITGFPAMGHVKLINTIKKHHLSEKVKFLGWVKRTKYFHLLRNSLLFVFPSVYEGFGLPPLEAMASGTPVLVSKKASLPEVVGKAGIFIDSEDPKGTARKIGEVLRNNRKYEQLVKKGLQRAKVFSWDKSYNKLRKIYRKFL